LTVIYKNIYKTYWK